MHSGLLGKNWASGASSRVGFVRVIRWFFATHPSCHLHCFPLHLLSHISWLDVGLSIFHGGLCSSGAAATVGLLDCWKFKTVSDQRLVWMLLAEVESQSVCNWLVYRLFYGASNLQWNGALQTQNRLSTALGHGALNQAVLQSGWHLQLIHKSDCVLLKNCRPSIGPWLIPKKIWS